MTISCRLIAGCVCRAYGIQITELYSRRRDRAHLRPRHMGWTLAKHLTTRSLKQIGRMMGGYDHSSVHHGIAQIQAKIETDATVSAEYNNLADALLSLERPCAVDGFEYQDIDPTETACAILSAPFRMVAPSLDEIRALAMGVLHYEAELDQLLAQQTAPTPTQPRFVLAQRPADAELKRTGRAVIRTWHALHEASFSGAGTINARRAFTDALKTLQITIERTEA